jgi:hypothetical protein
MINSDFWREEVTSGKNIWRAPYMDKTITVKETRQTD